MGRVRPPDAHLTTGRTGRTDNQGGGLLANAPSLRSERRGRRFLLLLRSAPCSAGRAPARCPRYRYILATNRKVGFNTANYGRRGSNAVLKTLSLLGHHNYLHSFLWI